MSIKIFYIPFHYRGSTEDLFRIATENVKGPDYSSILYISPTPKKLRDSRQIFYTLAGDCYIPPEMLTLKQLSQKLYSIYGSEKIIPHTIVPVILSKLSGRGIGFSAIISQFITEIKQYHPGKEVNTVSDELIGIFQELGIPEEVSLRAKEALNLFKLYQELLNRSSAADENDVMTVCPELIRMHCIRCSKLIIDGFYDLTRSEESIVKTLIETADDVLISIPYDINLSLLSNSFITYINNNFTYELIQVPCENDSSEPFYHPYPGIEEEIEGIARNIKNNFVSGKITDLEKIAVTFPLIDKYTPRVSRIFKKYGIPHSVLNSKTLGKTRPFLDLIALLESVTDNYPRLFFSQFLVSPCFRNLSPVFRNYIPRLCLITGISKGKDAWLNLSSFEQNRRDSETTKYVWISDLVKELRRVFKKLEPLEKLKDYGSYTLYSECIMKLLNDFDFSSAGSEDGDVKEKVCQILRELSFIDNLATNSTDTLPVTLRQFIDSLKHVLNTTETEMENAGVQIIGLHEIQGIEPEYLCIGGLKDGDLPAKPDIDHILPDSVRTRFGLSNLDRYLLLQKFIFFRAIASAPNLHLSYPSMEGDRFFLPSPYLPWNKEIPQKCYGIFSKEEELVRKGKTPLTAYLTETSNLKATLIKKSFGKDAHIRVTDIDSYRTCPRKFFIEKVLSLEPLEIKKYEIDAALLGTIMHEIMQAVISRPFRNLDDLILVAEELTETLLSHRSIEEYWKKVIGRTFLSILPDIYKVEKKIRDEGYSFKKAEVQVAGEIIKGIKLKGKIDRIDGKKIHGMQLTGSKEEKISTLNEDVIEIIDYKTGATQFSGPQVLAKGATLQLFLYASLMKALGAHVERVGIYSLKDMSVSWIPGRNDRRDGRTIADYLEASLRFLEEIVSQMRSGSFPADPLNEQTCRNCPERPYCPYIQKTTLILQTEKLSS